MRVLDHDLLALLEFRISRALARAEDLATRSLWCDGILPPLHDEATLRKVLHDRRRVELAAFVGADGQGRWSLILHLGDRGVSRVARGLDLAPCVPGVDEDGWVVARPVDRELHVYLR